MIDSGRRISTATQNDGRLDSVPQILCNEILYCSGFKAVRFPRDCDSRARDLGTEDYKARDLRSKRETAYHSVHDRLDVLHQTTSPKLLDEAWPSDVAGSHDKASLELILIASVGIDSFMQHIREEAIRGNYSLPARFGSGQRESDVLEEINIESSINTS